MTSATTLLVLFSLFIFGGEIIHGFATGLIIGVIVGTYSSVFVAACLLLQFKDVRNIRQPASDSPHIPTPEID